MKVTHEIEICTDCLVYLANGEVDDDGRDVTEKHYERMLADGWTPEQVRNMVPGGDEQGFSSCRCDGCGSTLGGDRFAAAVLGDMCEWFAGCARPATTVRPHPALGDVPICAQCDTKIASL